MKKSSFFYVSNGMNSCWHSLQNEKAVLSKNLSGRSPLMVWADFSSGAQLSFFRNMTKYMYLYFPFITSFVVTQDEEKSNINYLFQQNNVSFHFEKEQRSGLFYPHIKLASQKSRPKSYEGHLGCYNAQYLPKNDRMTWNTSTAK